MIKQSRNCTKCMDIDYSDDYRTMMDITNPYSYNFGRAKKEHTHTDAFSKFQNRMNTDYFYKR